MNELTDLASIRARYGEPNQLVLSKQLNELDDHSRRFIALSPFVVASTSDGAGRCDASPRGDKAGTVAKVIDERTLIIPDRTGNRRTDTMANITLNPHIGLMFMVPGLSETLRVNGTVKISIDEVLLASLSAEGKAPLAAIVVSVEEVFFHCGKAILRSELWNPDRRITSDRFPSLARILADQVAGVKVDDLERVIEEGYRTRLY